MRNLELVAPRRGHHFDELVDLLSKTFTFASYFRAREYWVSELKDSRNYDWKASRIGLIDGRIVTHFGVWGVDLRVGTATLRTAGIGAVATAGDLTRQGLMRRTAIACLDELPSAGYDASLLFGINDFYDKFGYVQAWPDTFLELTTTDLPETPQAPRLTPFRRRFSPDMIALYNRENRDHTGTAVRPTRGPRFNRSHPWSGRYWTGANDKRLRGYILVDGMQARLDVIDFAGNPDEVMAATRKLAVAKSCATVRFHALPLMSPLARRLRRLNCQIHTSYHRCGGAMARTLDLTRVLEKLAPELSRRITTSPLRNWTGTVRLADARQEVDITVSRGTVTIAPNARKTPSHSIRAATDLIPLFLGSDATQVTLENHAISLTGDASELIPVLFPPNYPMLAKADHF